MTKSKWHYGFQKNPFQTVFEDSYRSNICALKPIINKLADCVNLIVSC